MTQQNCEQNCDNKHNSDENDYSDEMNYFDSNYKELDDLENTVLINNVISFEVFCYRCCKSFTFNNQLYKYRRSNVYIKSSIKSFSKSANVFVNNHADFFSLIRFKVNLNQNINIEYDFRDWQYCTAKVSLFSDSEAASRCINIDAVFFQKQSKSISIRTIII